MKIFVIRHGQTNYNLQHLCNSDPSKDVFLTEQGMQQAETAAQELKDKAFEVIFISNLRRTQQTAEIVNRYHNVQLKVDDRLGDRKTGFDSKPAADFFAAVNASPNGLSAKFNDGESFVEEKERVFSFLNELTNSNYKSVLIVTHAEIMQIIYGYFHNLTDKDMWEMPEFKNTEVVVFDTNSMRMSNNP